jgi:hypothetical protein
LMYPLSTGSSEYSGVIFALNSYGSGKYLANLSKKVVSPLFQVKIKFPSMW